MNQFKHSLLSIFILLFLLSACAVGDTRQAKSSATSFLTGAWKTQGMEEYEVWEQESDVAYSGYAYRVKDGEKIVWEKMRVSKEKGEWQLAVRVPEQNEGKSIVFKLKTNPQEEWLFVNPDHDFPKSILYRKMSENEWFADVRGDDNGGFSIVLQKQENEK